MAISKQLRLRTQLILATALISFSLCAACLLAMRANVLREITLQSRDAMKSSVDAFARFERQQDSELLRTAALVSELPVLKSLTFSNDPLTVQDGSEEFWELSGADLFVLANLQGRVLAAHAPGPLLDRDYAQQLFTASLEKEQQLGWWHAGGTLFRVVMRPITAGGGTQEHVIGELVLGRHIDTSVAEQIRHFSGSDVVLISGESVIASTLDPKARDQIAQLVSEHHFETAAAPVRYEINSRPYEIAVVPFQTEPGTPIRSLILLPLDSSDAFLARLNRTIVILGIVIGLLGALTMAFISRAITRPLERLVGAVKAMARGDDTYSLPTSGAAEVQQLSSAFHAMRLQVSDSQRKQLEAEHLAALGRAAGSISHDLRHIVAAMVANAEFLHDAEAIGCDRDEVYEEIERASVQMVELIDSLVEIAREGHHLRLSETSFEEIVRRAVNSVQNNPEYRDRTIHIQSAGNTTGCFDGRKLGRAVSNLILNACQATSPITGRVQIDLKAEENRVECSISDNGCGIPKEISETLFQPFVSFGKSNGTGLGLAIASKIIREHHGELVLEHTSITGTRFTMRIPRQSSAASAVESDEIADFAPSPADLSHRS